jgi:CRISPR type III-A-associated RAMP protein Csm4
MQPAVLLRLRPLGPWRFGPGEGGQHQVDTLFRSDRIYSALTLAAESLGFLEEWLDATARAQTPAVVFSSLFPYQADTLFAPPPHTVWPPPASSVTSPSPVFLSKMRWAAARFVPMTVVEALLSGQPILADQWIIDAESGCLLRRDRPSQSPFRVVARTRGAVDRISTASSHLHASACIEFESSSGLWSIIRFQDESAAATWSNRVKACFRLLADTGFGGHRSSGWGQTAEPEFRNGRWPGLLTPALDRLARTQDNGAATHEEAPLFWLLSLYSPAPSDAVDWSLGSYGLVVRGGRVQSSAYAATGAVKKSVRMVAEGSVLSAPQEPVGAAVDVAPDGFTHPVYRAGFSLALNLPNRKEVSELPAVDTTPVESPLEAEKEQATGVEEAPAIQEVEEVKEAVSEAPNEEDRVDETPTVQETQEEAQAPVSETPNEESERSDNEV